MANKMYSIEEEVVFERARDTQQTQT